MPEERTKKKLTLSVDEEVIEKAKQLDLNISEITEGVLRGYAFKPDELEKASLIEAYKSLFDSMKELLRDYMTSVVVGEYEANPSSLAITVEIQFDGKGRFWETEVEAYTTFEEVDLYDLYSPNRILTNFVKALADASEKRKERIVELNVAKGIIDVITGSVKPKLKRDSVSNVKSKC